MAVKYLRSAAAGTGTGADWTNAYTTLTAALAGVAAGDTIYVADDHAETQASAMTLTSPGTASNPCRLICANTHVTTPPTGKATSATITTTGASGITLKGLAYAYGISFFCGSGANTATILVGDNSATPGGWTLEQCNLALVATNTGCRINFAGAQARAGRTKLIDTSLSFANASQGVYIASELVWTGALSTITGTLPTSLFTLSTNMAGMAEISGVDLSALGAGKSLVTGSANNGAIKLYFRNCKLGASVSVLSGAIVAPGGTEIYLDNCDSGSGNTRMEHYKYQGSIVSETTKVKSSGASDGTTPLSHKFVSLTAGPTLFSPLEGPWMTAWNDTTGSKTITVEFLHDSVTNLQNSDIYLEVEYLGTSGFPESVYANSRVTDVFATPADCAAGVGTGSWTTTGLSNPNSQKLSVTFTAQLKGVVRWRVCLAHSNYTVYVDPIASGLATVSRAYALAPGMYMNESAGAAAGGGAILSRMRTGY